MTDGIVAGHHYSIETIEMEPYPLSCVCYLETGHRGSDVPVKRGTGWVAGRTGLVATCGHNLLTATFETEWVNLWIGGDRRRSGHRYRVAWWIAHEHWRTGAFDPAHDLALVRVHADLSAHGAFGFRDEGLAGRKIAVAGFAATGPAQRRQLAGTVSSRTAVSVRYDLATIVGMSGAPVWTTNENGRPIAVAVHTRRNGTASGVRLTQQHIDWIARHR